MGDVVSLVEKAEDAVNAEEAAELTKRMMTGQCRARQGRAGGSGQGRAGAPEQ